MEKTPAITFPFPENQPIERVSIRFRNSITRFRRSTGHRHVSRSATTVGSVGRSTFSPESTVPDASINDYTATISEKLTLGKAELRSHAVIHSLYRGDLGPRPLKSGDTPNGNLGNYFAQQQRSSARTGWLSTYSLRPLAKLGVHNFKAGAYFAPSSENGQILERPYSILDSAGQLLEQVSFTGGSPVRRTDSEISFSVQDHRLVSPRLSIDAGLRAESQAITETFRLAPRFGIAWSPFAETGTILRAGVGLFYDRVPLTSSALPNIPIR